MAVYSPSCADNLPILMQCLRPMASCLRSMMVTVDLCKKGKEWTALRFLSQKYADNPPILMQCLSPTAICLQPMVYGLWPSAHGLQPVYSSSCADNPPILMQCLRPMASCLRPMMVTVDLCKKGKEWTALRFLSQLDQILGLNRSARLNRDKGLWTS